MVTHRTGQESYDVRIVLDVHTDSPALAILLTPMVERYVQRLCNKAVRKNNRKAK